MKARFTFGVIASLVVATLASAATNLNSSRSNIYRLTYPSESRECGSSEGDPGRARHDGSGR